MDEFPTEASPQGIVLALLVVFAPAASLGLGAFVKPKIAAFFAAVGTSGAIIFLGVNYALEIAPGKGTQMGAWAFGGWAGAVSLFMATAVVAGRALIWDRTPAPASVPASRPRESRTPEVPGPS